MKKFTYILSLLLGSAISAYGFDMPASSVMADGTWTKIRVMTDGVYQLTYDELNDLGYSSPESVKVFGYSPSLLVTCSFDVIPGDLTPIPTINLPEQKKILFYLSDNYDINPEVWRKKFTANDAAKRERHTNSTGATYFISDAKTDAANLGTVPAPASVNEEEALKSHKAVYYHEQDITSLTEAGSIFIEPATITRTNGVTHPFTVCHLASPDATLLFGAYVAPANTEIAGNMAAYFSEGIVPGATDGSKPSLLLQKEILTPEFRSQEFTMPMTVEPQTHTVTFKIPEDGLQQKPCALDFFFVKYDRMNDVGVRPQSIMYFLNEKKAATFELTGIDTENWKVWNITDPLKIKEILLTQNDDKFYGTLQSTSAGSANELIAFDIKADHPEPEIMGRVANQNLHAMNVPDMLIITSTPLLDDAETVADLHRRLQGLDVKVVDQMQIFNEYGSGNTSPEAVRRFITHLNDRQQSKLQGVLLLGPATFNNKELVGDNSPYVVTAQCEEPVLARNVTTNYSSDIYFVCAGEPQTTNPWSERHSTFCVFSNMPVAGIGRVPFKTTLEINEYYKKVETYLTQLPTFPSLGNIIVASDYSTPTEKSRTHMNDAELMLQAMDYSKHGRSVTVTRCASNIFSKDDNAVIKKIQNRTLAYGAQLYAFFGHGTATGISGSTTVNDPILTIDAAKNLNTSVRSPFMHIASCHVAAVDVYNSTLAGSLLANPNGGPVAVIGSGREVFPENNTELASEVAAGLDAAANNTPFGTVWADAVGRFNSRLAAYRKSLCNTLNYNLIGDPMLPVYNATNNVEINEIPNNTLSYVAPTEISGRITGLDGKTASDFNGSVILTFYDSPLTKPNVNTTNPSNNPGYLPSLTIDQDIIGQVIAEVRNGIFNVSTVAPSTTNPNNHRIQAYAYSTDATRRGLGYIGGINFTEAGEPAAATPTPVAIDNFEVEIAEPTSSYKYKATITAEFTAADGLAFSNALVNPIKLTIDGKSQANVSDMISPLSDGKYRLVYTTSKLEFGNHEATLAILDANDNWAEETLYFMVDNTPAATLSAAVENGEVNFEIASDIYGGQHRLVVERLNGDLAMDRTFTGDSLTVALDPGVYRAFVQSRSNSAATATQKIQFAVH